MRRMRLMLPVFCVLGWIAAPAVLGADAAATAPTTAPAAKAEPVIDHIPAGAMGYVVANSIRGGLDNAVKFIKDIGLASVLGDQDLIAFVQTAAQLGEGFNPNGGFAVVMLDPHAFNVDLPAFLDLGDPNAPQPEDVKLPAVIFIPASGVKELFSAYKMEPAEGYTKVHLRMGVMFAAQVGGYVIISPAAKAIDAVVKAEKLAAGELSKEQLDAAKEMDLAIQVNMKIAGPIYLKVMEQVAKPEGGPIPFGGLQILSAVQPMYQKILPQLQNLLLGVRFVPDGLTVQEFVTALPDSPMGKAVAAFKSADGPLLDRLPNLPYVLAFGAAANTSKEAADMDKEMMAKLVAGMTKVADADKARIQKVYAALRDQVEMMQVVAGGPPNAHGLFGLAIVIKCKDSQKTKDLLAEGADLASSLIATLLPVPQIAGLKFVYAKDAEKLGDLSVDTIQVTPGDQEKMTDEDKADANKIFGEESIRFRVVAPDAATVVITFGGAGAMLAEAVKAAKDGGTILKSEGLDPGMKYMPKPTQSLIVINAGNLWGVMTKAIAAMGSPSDMPPFTISAKTAILVGSSIAGNSVHATVFIPNALVKDVVNAIQQAMGGPATKPAPKGGDF